MTSVPAYPASHGCVRMTVPTMDRMWSSLWSACRSRSTPRDYRKPGGAAPGASSSGCRRPGANGPRDRAFRPGLFGGMEGRLGGMGMIVRRVWAWLCRRSALALLLATLSGLAAGALAGLAGASTVQDAAWMASAACGLGYAIWSALESLRRGRVGVDIIALLALAGAVAVGELLAAAVISIMLTSGRSLEAWAAERARHDLNALLARAPRSARRYRCGSLETVPLDEIAIGDVLLVAPGDVLPVDGSVTSRVAILDESALTGEALPVEHRPGDGVHSGTLNVGGPFDLRAETSAADSTYAGIV